LKIGGGSVTHKDDNRREAKVDVIRRIAREIKRAKNSRAFRLVVVHGAGPFGHRLVTDYDIKEGLNSPGDVEGFVRTHNSMEDLNKVFMDVFREEGLLGFPIQPSAVIIQNEKRIDVFHTEVIEHLLGTSNDIIPILYGDMVIDRAQKASVVSGDAIVPYLARKLKANRILMGTDVDGIYTADPKLNPDAKFLEHIGPGNYEGVMRQIGEASTVDVTKGMKGKITEIIQNLSGFSVLIFNITEKDNVFKALAGHKINGTEICV